MKKCLFFSLLAFALSGSSCSNKKIAEYRGQILERNNEICLVPFASLKSFEEAFNFASYYNILCDDYWSGLACKDFSFEHFID